MEKPRRRRSGKAPEESTPRRSSGGAHDTISASPEEHESAAIAAGSGERQGGSSPGACGGLGGMTPPHWHRRVFFEGRRRLRRLRFLFIIFCSVVFVGLSLGVGGSAGRPFGSLHGLGMLGPRPEFRLRSQAQPFLLALVRGWASPALPCFHRMASPS